MSAVINEFLVARQSRRHTTFWGKVLSWLKRIPYDEYQDVKDFHLKFGLLAHDEPVHLTQRKLMERRQFLQEELDEFGQALTQQDMAKMADALVDLVYVAKGTAVMMGLPWEQLWSTVQYANMQKVRGTTHRGHAVDVKKPPGWEPPAIDFILDLYGYDRDDWSMEMDGAIDEELCADDAHAI